MSVGLGGTTTRETKRRVGRVHLEGLILMFRSQLKEWKSK